MGHLHATEFKSAVDDGAVTLEVALGWHLQYNHYPPVPLDMVPVCVEAIEAVSEGDHQREIDLRGSFYRGSPTAPAGVIVESHHLGAFLDVEED